MSNGTTKVIAEGGGTAKVKKKFKMPHTLVLMMVINLFAVLLTWLIPAGEFVRMQNAQGITVADPTSFHFTGANPINPLMIPTYIMSGSMGSASLLFFTLLSGAAFEVIISSGALQSLVGKLSNKIADREVIFIPVLTTMFALICTTISIEHFIAFAPVMAMITRAFGLDSIMGAAIMIFGGGIGFSTGTLNPNTTILSQKIAELPLYSGIEFRFLSMVIFLIVSNIYLIRYAKKIRKNPELSPVYELDQKYRMEENTDIDSFGELTVRKILVILSLVVALAMIVIGGVKLGWGVDENSAIFIGLAIVSGIFAGKGASEIANEMVAGARRMVGIAMIIGCARAVAGILSAGCVLDTVVYVLGQGLMMLPRFLQGIAMFWCNIIINFFISSGSGQAAVVMPIFVPMADMVGITRQTAVLAFNFGDGFCNYILPHGTTMMGIIGICGIAYGQWMKFMWKMFAIWVVTGSILVLIAQMIQLGPL